MNTPAQTDKSMPESREMVPPKNNIVSNWVQLWLHAQNKAGPNTKTGLSSQPQLGPAPVSLPFFFNRLQRPDTTIEPVAAVNKAVMWSHFARNIAGRFETFARRYESNPLILRTVSRSRLILANQVDLEDDGEMATEPTGGMRMATFQEMMARTGRPLPAAGPTSTEEGTPQRPPAPPRPATFQEMLDRIKQTENPAATPTPTLSSPSESAAHPTPPRAQRIVRRPALPVTKEGTAKPVVPLSDSLPVASVPEHLLPNLSPPDSSPAEAAIDEWPGESVHDFASPPVDVPFVPRVAKSVPENATTRPIPAHVIKSEKTVAEIPAVKKHGDIAPGIQPDSALASPPLGEDQAFSNTPDPEIKKSALPRVHPPEIPGDLIQAPEEAAQLPLNIQPQPRPSKFLPKVPVTPEQKLADISLYETKSAIAASPTGPAANLQTPGEAIAKRIMRAAEMPVIKPPPPLRRSFEPVRPALTPHQAAQRLQNLGWRFKSNPGPDLPASPAVTQAMEHLEQADERGKPLPSRPRQLLESALGQPFDQVRTHTAPLAPLNVQAATKGSDVYFEPGQSHFESPSSLALLGHELTHVAQQTAAGPGGTSVQRDEQAAEQNEQTLRNYFQPSANLAWSTDLTMPFIEPVSAVDPAGPSQLPEPELPLLPRRSHAATNDVPSGNEPAALQKLENDEANEIGSKGQKEQTADLRQLAKKIYPLIKRRLAIERQQMG